MPFKNLHLVSSPLCVPFKGRGQNDPQGDSTSKVLSFLPDRIEEPSAYRVDSDRKVDMTRMQER